MDVIKCPPVPLCLGPGFGADVGAQPAVPCPDVWDLGWAGLGWNPGGTMWGLPLLSPNSLARLRGSPLHSQAQAWKDILQRQACFPRNLGMCWGRTRRCLQTPTSPHPALVGETCKLTEHCSRLTTCTWAGQVGSGTLTPCTLQPAARGVGITLLLPLKEGSQLGAGKGKGPRAQAGRAQAHPCSGMHSMTPSFPGRWILGVSTPNRLLSLPNRVHCSALGSKGRAGGGGEAEDGAYASELDWLKAQNLPF